MDMSALYARADRVNAYGTLCGIFAILWTLDVATTLLALGQGWQEGNLGFLSLMTALGFAWAFVIKFAWGGVLLAFSWLAVRVLPRATCVVLAAMCGGMLAIVLSNAAHVLGSLLLVR